MCIRDSLQVVGILISIFYSLFLGTEYNDGTIRNKLIVGHKRETIYLASFITGTVAVTIIYFIWGLIGGIFTLVSHASVNITLSLIHILELLFNCNYSFLKMFLSLSLIL